MSMTAHNKYYASLTREQRRARNRQATLRFNERAEAAGLTPWQYKQSLNVSPLFCLPDGCYEVMTCARCPDSIAVMEVYSRAQLYAMRDEDELPEGMTVRGEDGRMWLYQNCLFVPMEGER